MACSGVVLGGMDVTPEVLAAKFGVIFPHLDERQRRLLMGAEARALGHGGIRLVARAAGMREATVSAGVAELEGGAGPLGRVRRPGGGRKRAAEVDRGLVPALLALVEPDMRGDPMSPLRWTVKSTRKLAAELTAGGHPVSADTVGDLLRGQGFSLQANAKTLEGAQHRDRDGQFRYIAELAKAHQAAGQPVISVDTKKKEKVGNYAAAGAEWAPKGAPVAVRDHDFPCAQDPPAAIPYGIYDLAANAGWVNVGTDHDTAAFAAGSVRRWWDAAGQAAYPGASRLLVTADAGGSNGYRTRAWKAGLAALAAETGLQVTCCHFPPGTSKWNKIEHRLFSHISMNWRGRPLTSHEVIVNTIAATTTATGLTVHAQLDTGLYPTGIKISGQQMDALALTPHAWHPTWNYTLHPTTGPAPPPATPPRTRKPRCPQTALAHPAVTGMPRAALATLITTLAPAWNAHRQAAAHIRRGRPRQRHNPAYDRDRTRLDLTDQILATLIHHRLALPRYLIAYLLCTGPDAIATAINLTQSLLTPHLSPPPPAPARTAALRHLCQQAQTAGVTLPAKLKAACY
jgi:Rhodopirellula transposase DDE domain